MNNISCIATLFITTMAIGSTNAAAQPQPAVRVPTSIDSKKAPVLTPPGGASVAANPSAPTLVVRKDVQIDVQKFTVAYGAAVTLHASLKSTGMPLANKPVTFMFESGGTPVTVAGMSDSAGNVDVSATVPSFAVGMHTMKVVFDGDGNYKPAQGENTFNLIKTFAKIDATVELRHEVVVANAPPQHYYLFISGKLYRDTDKKGLIQPIFLNFKGQELANTLSGWNGEFHFKVPFENPAGHYVLTADYSGSNKYSDVSRPLNVTIPSVVFYSKPTIDLPGGAKVGQKAIISSKLTTPGIGAGTVVPNKKLTICIVVQAVNPNRACADATSDATGLAKVTLPLFAGGSNQVDIFWSDGDLNGKGSMPAAQFNVAKAATKVIATIPDAATVGEILKVEAQLNIAATGKPATCYALTVHTRSKSGDWHYMSHASNFYGTCYDVTKPFNLDFKVIDAPGPLEVKVSQEGDAGNLPSETIFNVQIHAALIDLKPNTSTRKVGG